MLDTFLARFGNMNLAELRGEPLTERDKKIARACFLVHIEHEVRALNGEPPPEPVDP